MLVPQRWLSLPVSPLFSSAFVHPHRQLKRPGPASINFCSIFLLFPSGRDSLACAFAYLARRQILFFLFFALAILQCSFVTPLFVLFFPSLPTPPPPTLLYSIFFFFHGFPAPATRLHKLFRYRSSTNRNKRWVSTRFFVDHVRHFVSRSLAENCVRRGDAIAGDLDGSNEGNEGNFMSLSLGR